MKKKISILMIAMMAILTLLPLTSAFAYTGGLLNGKTINRGIDQNSISDSNTTATDNNETTYYSWQPNGQNDTFWYEFPTVVSINSYQLKTDDTLAVIDFYDSTGTKIISVSNLDENGVKTNITQVDNVKKVVLRTTDTRASGAKLLYEFDIFSPVFINYSGGLLDNQPLEIMYNQTISTGNTTPNSTDNNQTTSFSLSGASSATTESPDHLHYRFSTPKNITGYRFNGSADADLIIKKADGTSGFYGAITDKTGTLINASVENVTDVYIINKATTTNVIKEFNVYGSEYVPPVQSDLIAPAEITDLLVTTTKDSVTFNWSNPSDSDFETVHIYQDGGLIGSASNGTYTVTGLTPATQYNFTFKTEDTSANISTGYGKTVTTNDEIDNTAPTAPTGLDLNSGASNGGSLSWNRNTETDIQGYNIYIDGVKDNATPITNTYYTVTGLEAGKDYSITITAVDTSGNESPVSAPLAFTPDTDSMPILSMGYSLDDVADGTSTWFSEIWLIIAFAVAIPLSFYIANRIKLLFLS